MVARAMPVDDPERIRAAYEEQVRLLTEALGRRDQELGILSAVAARVHGEEDAERILDIALEEILRQMQLNTAWVFMGDEKEKKLHLAASRGVNPAYLEEIRTEGLGECLCPEVFWTGHRMQVRNTTQCPRMPTIVEGLAAPVAHACIPLRFEGHRRGVLNVAARPGQTFTEDELRFLEAVGDTAGTILGADQLYIFLGSDARALRVAHLSGRTDPRVKERAVVDLSTMGWHLSVAALAERRLVRMDDRELDEHVDREEARRVGAASALAVPLETHDTVRGVLLIARTAPHRWTEEETDLAEALAAQAS